LELIKLDIYTTGWKQFTLDLPLKYTTISHNKVKVNEELPVPKPRRHIRGTEI